MVGLFINTLPVRVHVSPRDTLVEWLRELQEQQVTLREYEYTPLFEIQKWSEVSAGEPLFNTLLVFENTPLDSGEHLTTRAAGLDVQPAAGAGGDQTNYPLVLIVIPGHSLRLYFRYDTRRYTAEAITRLVGHLQQVLAALVGGMGQQRLGAILLLTDAERRQLLVDWNATAMAYPREATLAQRFAAQAAATPDAVALVFEEQQLSYRELHTRAGHLGPESAAALRRGAGGTGRAVPAAQHRDDRRRAGHHQGRRRLCAAGPQCPARTSGVYIGGCRRHPRAHPGRCPGRAAGRVVRARHRPGQRLANDSPRPRPPTSRVARTPRASPTSCIPPAPLACQRDTSVCQAV